LRLCTYFGSVCLLTIAAGGLACSDDASHASPEAGPDLDATAGDGSDDAAPEAAAPTQALVRFANLAPDMRAVDVCLAVHGTGAFKGPLLAQSMATAGLPPDANAPGLSFTNVSGYLAIDPGTYDLRLVVAGSASCTVGASVAPEAGADANPEDDAGAGPDGDAGLDANVDGEAGAGGADTDAGAAADADTDAGVPADAGFVGSDAETPAAPQLPLPPGTTNLPAFVAGGFVTVLLAGDVAPVGGDAPFRAGAVQDDATLSGGGASLRAINALPGVLSADFGFGSAAGSWSPLFTDVAFGAASLMAAPSQGKVDANGYLPIAPFGPGVVSVRASGDGGSDIASTSAASVSLGTVATVCAAGGTSGAPPVLIVCADNAPIGSPLGACSVLP
jgi:hypothetical protein